MSRGATPSLERRRAAYVLREIQEWDADWRSEAVRCARGLPAALRSQGLLVTVARLRSADRRSAEIRLADVIARWLLQDAPVRTLAAPSGLRRPAERLLAACRQADRVSYRQAQAEAIALVDRVKLLADALDELWTAGSRSTPAAAPAVAGRPLLSERRLAFAFDEVLAWKEGIDRTATTKSMGLPVEVGTEGLLVALANLVRSRSAGQKALAELIARWLLHGAPRKPLELTEDTETGVEALLKACALAGRTEYRAAEAEVLALLGGVKTYARGMTRGSDNGD